MLQTCQDTLRETGLKLVMKPISFRRATRSAAFHFTNVSYEQCWFEGYLIKRVSRCKYEYCETHSRCSVCQTSHTLYSKFCCYTPCDSKSFVKCRKHIWRGTSPFQRWHQDFCFEEDKRNTSLSFCLKALLLRYRGKKQYGGT